jgi:hypothetical protein
MSIRSFCGCSYYHKRGTAGRTSLQEKVEELEQFHEAVVCREVKMMELEKEVAGLRQQLAIRQSE